MNNFMAMPPARATRTSSRAGSRLGHPASIAIAEPDDIVWLRDLDGTGSMHVCMPHDDGAIMYVRFRLF